MAEEGIAAERRLGLLDWLGAWLEWAKQRLFDSLKGLPGFAPLATLLRWAILGLAVLTAGYLALLLLRRLTAGTRPARPSPVPARVEPLPPAPDHEAALARALALGDPTAAVRAAWLGLVARLSAAGVGRWAPEQTNREFVAGARRASPTWPHHEALGSLARAVDRHLYAGRPPGLDDARRLIDGARELAP